MQVILASASPRRKEILACILPSFSVEASGFDEHTVRERGPSALVAALSRGKAEEVFARFPSAAVLAADTVVWFGGRALGKPKSKAEAAATLRMLSGRRHAVYTGWCLLSPRGVRRGVCKELSEAFIAAYVAGGSPMDKAGSYGIQDDPSPVARCSGSFTNVIGLPQEEVAQAFKDIGILS